MQIAIMAVFGAICAIVAQSRGRSALGWFIFGAFFGCIPLVLLFVIPDLKIQQEREDRRERQIDRIRERQHKDRAMVDRQLEAQNRRLAAHDHALGVDTSEGIAPAPRINPPQRMLANPRFADVDWYYAVDDASDVEFGPVTWADLQSAYSQGILGGRSPVWCDGMGDWKKVEAVPGLLDALEGLA